MSVPFEASNRLIGALPSRGVSGRDRPWRSTTASSCAYLAKATPCRVPARSPRTKGPLAYTSADFHFTQNPGTLFAIEMA